MANKEKNIEKDINEIMDYIKDLKEENKKQKKDLEELEHYRKAKQYIERMYGNPFYTRAGGTIYKYEKGKNYGCIEYSFEDDAIDVIDYESKLYISVKDIEKEIIFYNDEIETEYQKQEEEEMRKYEERRKNNPIWYGAVFNCTSGGNKDEN